MGTLHVYASLIFGPSAPVETSNKGRVESRNDGRGEGGVGPKQNWRSSIGSVAVECSHQTVPPLLLQTESWERGGRMV